MGSASTVGTRRTARVRWPGGQRRARQRADPAFQPSQVIAALRRWVRDSRLAARHNAGMGPHLVGRSHEFGELARVVAGAATGEGALVVLSGEAGIGKTTMLSWLAGTAASAGMPVLAGRAVADEGAPAFWPWLRVLGQGQKLGLSPMLLELGDGPAAQARFVAAERTALALVAAAAPVGLLVTLDDLQWADDAT